jgi:excisionase family DNA binding protein
MVNFTHGNCRDEEFKNGRRFEMSMLTSTSLYPVRVEPEHYVTSDEVASFLKLNLRTVQRLAREGTIPAHPFGEKNRKTWRFLLSELDEWMRAKVNSSRRPCRSVGS